MEDDSGPAQLVCRVIVLSSISALIGIKRELEHNLGFLSLRSQLF